MGGTRHGGVPFATTPRPNRPLRDRHPTRGRRDGRGLPGSGPDARAEGRAQDPPTRAGPARRSDSTIRARGQVRLVAQSPQHRHDLRDRRVFRASSRARGGRGVPLLESPTTSRWSSSPARLSDEYPGSTPLGTLVGWLAQAADVGKRPPCCISPGSSRGHIMVSKDGFTKVLDFASPSWLS